MSFKIASLTATAVLMVASPVTTPPVAEDEEYYSSWSLFLVCILLVLSLLTSYYLQIKRIRAVHETLVSIFAGMFVGLVIRLAPGTMIRDMLVSLSACLVIMVFRYLRYLWFLFMFCRAQSTQFRAA
jgi:sodium/hydrogen exchanger-like protein 6/7